MTVCMANLLSVTDGGFPATKDRAAPPDPPVGRADREPGRGPALRGGKGLPPSRSVPSWTWRDAIRCVRQGLHRDQGETPARGLTTVRPPPLPCEIQGRPHTLSAAATREEREEAYAFVHNHYVKTGYIAPEPSGLWYTAHAALPQTATLVIRSAEGRIVATGTVIPDSPLGLPADDLFRAETDSLRKAGRRLCEICSLVADEGEHDGGISAVMYLFRAAVWYAMHVLGADDLISDVTPRHARFYKRALLLEDLGAERPDPRYRLPAVALRLDTRTIEARTAAKYSSRTDGRNFDAFFFQVPERAPTVDYLRVAVTPLDAADGRHFFLGNERFRSRTPAGHVAYLREVLC